MERVGEGDCRHKKPGAVAGFSITFDYQLKHAELFLVSFSLF
ncbi:hypothetical protein DR73_2259 [Enterobacteriaceae bacterium ATCC 29904]|nr:hypothetical protein DR73_2259 [Enterobacteriaceae bacterium ATCC 29904]